MTGGLHAYVISWTGWGDRARAIAESLVDIVDRLVVIYSNSAGVEESGPGHWIQVTDDNYYGGKFRAALDDFEGDVMMHVQADAWTDDWPALVSSCRRLFELRPNLGVWSPHVEYTGLTLERTTLRTEEHLHHVTMTDSIVWAMPLRICDWLRTLEVQEDKYAWSLDVCVSAHCHANGLEAIVDTAVHVDHPKGTAYNTNDANLLIERFTSTRLTPAELSIAQLSQLYFDLWDDVYDLRQKLDAEWSLRIPDRLRMAARKRLSRATGRADGR